MPRRGSDDVRTPVAAFRAALLLVCGGLALLADAAPLTALPVLLALATLAAAAYFLSFAHRHAEALSVVEFVVAAAAVPYTGGARSALLPYLLAPALALGLLAGARSVMLGASSAAAALLAARLIRRDAESTPGLEVASVQWVLLGLAVGLAAAWARRLSMTSRDGEGEFAEARALLHQLRTVTRRLPGGLDAPTAAQSLLDRCHELTEVSRSAVLTRPASGALMPMAVRGAKRVPWRAPLSEPGPLGEAWHSATATLDVRPADRSGRRRGSALAVLPLMSDDGPYGLVILESYTLTAFDGLLPDLARIVDDGALRLETALLFDEVRAAATLEERDRLARDMHDGIAQEIAFLGYQLDDLRSRATKVDPDLGDAVAVVRKDLTRLISDIRLSITDLRTSVGAERGLGQALSSHVRAVGSGKDVTVHLSLQESAFRLNGEQEVVLLQIAQAAAQDLRRSTTARNFWVTLLVDPPSARLTVEHDGPMRDLGAIGLEQYVEPLARLGGRLELEPGAAGGPCITAVLEGDDEVDPRNPGR